MSELYRVTAVIDDHTCDPCRRLHGTIVTREELVDHGLQYEHCENDLNGCRCAFTTIEEDTMDGYLTEISGEKLQDLEEDWRKRGSRVRRGDLLLILGGKKDKFEASAAAFEQCADELHALLVLDEDDDDE